jgi:hypothetical protein
MSDSPAETMPSPPEPAIPMIKSLLIDSFSASLLLMGDARLSVKGAHQDNYD